MRIKSLLKSLWSEEERQEFDERIHQLCKECGGGGIDFMAGPCGDCNGNGFVEKTREEPL